LARAVHCGRTNAPEEQMFFRSRIGAVILIIVGTLFLLSNLGLLPRLGPLFQQWWPLILIVVGALMLVRRL
jgi:cell wall-active antibiotic response 4TMS protein YvqF